MTRTQTYLLGAAVWLGSIGAFAGFAFAINRPSTIPAPPEPAPVEITAATITAARAEIPRENFVTIAPIEIVGHLPKSLHFPEQVIAPSRVSPPAEPPVLSSSSSTSPDPGTTSVRDRE